MKCLGDSLQGNLEDIFDLTYVREFTVEAGRPDSITYDKLKAIKAHPVTRISINPQSMKQRTLELIGRSHTPEEIEELDFYISLKDTLNQIFVPELKKHWNAAN